MKHKQKNIREEMDSALRYILSDEPMPYDWFQLKGVRSFSLLRKPRYPRITIYVPECPYSSKKGYTARSVYVWWIHNPYDEIAHNEVIHHINFDPQDDRIENLMKVTRKQHGIIHSEFRLKPYPETFKNTLTYWCYPKTGLQNDKM